MHMKILMMKRRKKSLQRLNKYFKNRYISFLKTLKEDNIKKKEEEEKARQKKERLKARMKQKFGIENVQSRFRSEAAHEEAELKDKLIRKPHSVAKGKGDRNRLM